MQQLERREEELEVAWRNSTLDSAARGAVALSKSCGGSGVDECGRMWHTHRTHRTCASPAQRSSVGPRGAIEPRLALRVPVFTLLRGLFASAARRGGARCGLRVSLSPVQYLSSLTLRTFKYKQTPLSLQHALCWRGCPCCSAAAASSQGRARHWPINIDRRQQRDQLGRAREQQ